MINKGLVGMELIFIKQKIVVRVKELIANDIKYGIMVSAQATFKEVINISLYCGVALGM